ncbi:MAG: C40 family peptidase [Deltaproteobacteria bacterium]
MRRVSPLALALAWSVSLGCAGGRAGLRGGHSAAFERSAVVRAARSLLGARDLRLDGRPLPPDCWSLPVVAYGRSGLMLGGGDARGLFEGARAAGRLRRDGRPRPGDLLFTETGRAAGPTEIHVGLVGAVDPDGTLLVYQRMARGVIAYHLNPGHPTERVAPESHRPWNDPIAVAPGQRRSAGELYAGFASFLP